MKNFLKKYFSRVSLFLIIPAVLLGNNVSAEVYVGPTQTAPGGNVAAPINTSASTQIKDGGLYIGGGSGDIDGSGSTGAGDVVKIMNYVSGSSTPSEEQYAEADVSGDGIIDAIDIQLALNISVGSLTVKEAHLEGKLKDSRALGKTMEGGVVIGSGGIEFADGSIQTTGLEANIDSSLCYVNTAGTDCKAGYFLKSTTKCCPFSAAMAAASGTWFNVESVYFDVQNDMSGQWAPEQIKTFNTPKTITAMRLSGYTDDGGYCYAYWGGGNVYTTAQSKATIDSIPLTVNFMGNYTSSYSVFSKDNSEIPRLYDATRVVVGSPTMDVEGNYTVCSNGTYLDNGKCVTYTCSAGDTYQKIDVEGGEGSVSTYHTCRKQCPWVVDNNGKIEICQKGNIPANLTVDLPGATKTGLNIPAGTIITLKGRNVDGGGLGRIQCKMEVQYGN